MKPIHYVLLVILAVLVTIIFAVSYYKNAVRNYPAAKPDPSHSETPPAEFDPLPPNDYPGKG